MRLITLAPLAVAVSRAGGLGFLAAGTDVSNLKSELQKAAELLAPEPIQGSETNILPIGVGFINWGVQLNTVLEALHVLLYGSLRLQRMKIFPIRRKRSERQAMVRQ